MASVLNEAYFTDEAAAFAALEAIVWPNGPICPHCGAVDRLNRLPVQRTKPSKKHPEGKPVYGLWKCYHCRGQFTVRKGTVFEASHLELHKWFQAAFLLCSSKKGVSSNQLHRTLGCTLKTAWFVSHRLREAMRQGELAVPFGTGGGDVEADETFIGREPGKPKKRAYHHKMKVLSLLDRSTGKARSMVVENLRPATIVPILEENIAKEARVMTDEGGHYYYLDQHFAGHGVVRHGQEEYVNPNDRTIHTNTIEGYFSIFKRGMKGVYQHTSKKHLHRYLAEFDFRYNNRLALGVNDMGRTETALRGIVGKRLMYRDSLAPRVQS
jgi:transposase-like protein